MHGIHGIIEEKPMKRPKQFVRSLRDGGLDAAQRRRTADQELGAPLQRWLHDERFGSARPVTLAEVDGRSLPVRLGDGVARLRSPYL
jgi:hypothetical protein